MEEEFYMMTTLKIDGEDVPFKSMMPYRPEACEKCGAFRNTEYKIRVMNLKYVFDKFLCRYCRSGPPWSKVKTIQIVRRRPGHNEDED